MRHVQFRPKEPSANLTISKDAVRYTKGTLKDAPLRHSGVSATGSHYKQICTISSIGVGVGFCRFTPTA
jgi:hypothetical protein